MKNVKAVNIKSLTYLFIFIFIHLNYKSASIRSNVYVVKKMVLALPEFAVFAPWSSLFVYPITI